MTTTTWQPDHDVTVEFDDDGYQAVCPCGWTGTLYNRRNPDSASALDPSNAAAEAEAERHREATE